MTGGGKRSGAVFPVLAAALLGALALSAATGPVPISLRAAFDAIFRGADDTPARVLLSLRLPRALLGALVGGALATSGVAFQALLRNPLADPYILGVSGGAAVGALTVALFLSADASPLLPLCAFGGAALSALAVFLLARRRSGISPERLILMGVVVGAFLNAVIMLMVTLAPPGKIPGALYWLMGDLGLGTPRRVAVLFPYVALGTVLLYLLSRGLDLLLLGEHAAFQAGLSVERVKTARADSAAPPKAHSGRSGDASADRKRATVSAPTAAPPDTPRIYGSASGLRSSAWKATPEEARAPPTRAPRSARGSRSDNRTRAGVSSAPRKIASKAARRETGTGPVAAERASAPRSAAASTGQTAPLLFPPPVTGSLPRPLQAPSGGECSVSQIA